MPLQIALLSPAEAAAAVPELARLLQEAVADGASVGFLPPLADDAARQFWHGVVAGVAAGERTLLAAFEGADLVGTVQLVRSSMPNQVHRGDVAKMLVAKRAQRQGLGAALLARVEAVAADAGLSLLVLDTVPGHAGERLYQRHGWLRAGEIPGYALDGAGGAFATIFFYKQI
jgi:GNAT superfamily N-acetyltransferase